MEAIAWCPHRPHRWLRKKTRRTTWMFGWCDIQVELRVKGEEVDYA